MIGQLPLAGVGAGPAIAAVCCPVAAAFDRRFGPCAEIAERETGLAALADKGVALPAAVVRAADGVIPGPANIAARPALKKGGINPSLCFARPVESHLSGRSGRARAPA